MTDTPWDDLKVCFSVKSSDRLWRAAEDGRLQLPDGWELNETDCSGAREVAIFRVDGKVPTPADAFKVKAQLRRFGA